MAADPQLPRPQSAVIDSRDWATTEWYEFWRQLLEFARENGGTQAQLAAIEARLSEIEADLGSASIVGLNSIFVTGTLADGSVQIQLDGDVQSPGNTYYYGTGPTGTKGFFTVSSTFLGADSVVKTTDSAGISTFRLDGDIASPGSLFGYGTNMAGAKGWYRPALFESTGLLSGGTLSINAGDNTKFDVSQAVIGQTDYTTNAASPTRAVVVYGPTTANSVPNLAITATWVGLQMPAGTLVTQSSRFTDTQLRTIIQLGAVISNGTNLIAVNNLPNVMRAGINQISDLMTAIGPINNGNLIGPNGANLQINKGAGVVFKQGANFANNANDPHNLPLAALTAANFNYRTSTGVQAATTNAINVTQYESPLGTLATVPNNRFTVQRIYVFTSNLIRIQYGQTVYQTMAEAEAAIATQTFSTESNIAENGVLLAFLIVEKSATDLSNPAQAKFIPADKFGGVVGSGGTSITNTDSLPEGVVNLYFTNERAQDAVGTILVDSASIDFTYDDAANTITAIVAAAYDALLVKLAGAQTITGKKTIDNDLAFSGVGRRIQADFSAASPADRTSLQSNVANGFTALQTIPNGTSQTSGFIAFNNSNLANSGFFTGLATATAVMFGTSVTGAAPNLPMRFTIVGVPAAEINTTATALNPGSDNTVNLGGGSLRWKEVFAVAGTINTSDRDQKDEFRALSAVELAAASDLAKAVTAFKWKDAIEAKGRDGARWHVGWIAQEVRDIMAAHGLDGFAYGFLCFDEWDEYTAPEEVGEDGSLLCVAINRPAGSAYGLRKDELQAFITAAQEQRLQALEALLNP